MKKKLTVFLLFVCIQLLFSEEIFFKLKNDVYVTDGNVGSSEVFVEKNQLLELNSNIFFYKNRNNENCIYLNYQQKGYLFNLSDLELQQENIQMPEAFKNTYWIMSYYYDFLKSKDVKILFENEKEWNRYPDNYDESNNSWKYYFNPLYLLFEEYYIMGSNNLQYGELNILGKGTSWKDSQYKFNILEKYIPRDIQPEWEPLTKITSIIFIIDGDFLLVYKNNISENNLLFTLAKADKNTINQITKLVKNGSCSTSGIKFPKHAKEAATKTTAQPSTNVTPNKTMSVTENLKLRSGEATTTSVLTVMQAGTKVKILELGKAETIDGINSNWVKVEVQGGAKDRDGKEIKKGTVGWCYGGYLE